MAVRASSTTPRVNQICHSIARRTIPAIAEAPTRQVCEIGMRERARSATLRAMDRIGATAREPPTASPRRISTWPSFAAGPWPLRFALGEGGAARCGRQRRPGRGPVGPSKPTGARVILLCTDSGAALEARGRAHPHCAPPEQGWQGALWRALAARPSHGFPAGARRGPGRRHAGSRSSSWASRSSCGSIRRAASLRSDGSRLLPGRSGGARRADGRAGMRPTQLGPATLQAPRRDPFHGGRVGFLRPALCDPLRARR